MPVSAAAASRRPKDDDAALITSARHAKSLDVHARTRRYLWTMLIRAVLFVAMFLVPGVIAKIACLVGAAVLPAIAVLLANDVDKRTIPEVDEPEPTAAAALLPGTVIRGEVVEEDR